MANYLKDCLFIYIIMYNYLAYIGLALASYYFRPTALLTCSSIYNLYHNNNKSNLTNVILLLSLYLFGAWSTLMSAFTILIYKFVSNYDMILEKLTKWKKDYSEVAKLYNEKKSANQETFVPSMEIEFIENIVDRYNKLLEKVSMQYQIVSNNTYITKMSNFDYMYYINYVNSLMQQLFDKLGELIESKTSLRKYKDDIGEKLSELTKQFNSPNNTTDQLQLQSKDLSVGINTDIQKLGEMNVMMESMMKQMNMTDVPINGEQPKLGEMNGMMESMMKQLNMPEMPNMNGEQPKMEDLTKLMGTLTDLRKMSEEIDELPSLNRAQRRQLQKKTKKYKKT